MPNTVSLPEDLIKKIEDALLEHILAGLKDRSLSPDEAQQLAKDFLALLPISDRHDLLHKLNSLTQQHTTTQKLFLEFAAPIIEEEQAERLHTLSEFVKAGKIEEGILFIQKGGPS